MRIRHFLPAAAALVVAACGRGDEGAREADNGLAPETVNVTADDTANAAESGPAMAAADFASAIAASDMYEIESGRLASEKAASAQIKSFGQMLVTDHQKSTADLKAAASGARPAVAVMPAMTAEQQQMLDALRAADAGRFDRLFVEQQKQAHQKALATLQGYASGGDVDALKTFAAKAAPIVQKHLDQLGTMTPGQ